MAKRPFLVMPSGNCIPLEGEYRVEQLDDGWYVLGRNSVAPCGSEVAALATLEMLLHEGDAHALAQEALEGLPAQYRLRDQ